MRNLEELSSEELQEFLDSFDVVLSDCDGVLLHVMSACVEGAPETFKMLEKLGKKIKLVSNNSTQSIEKWQALLKSVGFDFEPKDLINPSIAIVQYLKSINFDKEIFMISLQPMKEEVKKAGFKIAEAAPDRIEESLDNFKSMLKDNTKIGAVVCDWDFNSNYLTFLKASIYLQRPEVLFITGGNDKKLPVGNGILGPGYFQNILSDFSKKVPLNFGKPSIDLKHFLQRQHNIKNPSRVLFIGDNPVQDMKFANRCGHIKLLVFTGIAKKEDLKNLQDEEKCDFYVHSIGDLKKLVEKKLPHLLVEK